jgi:hypothetical protein
VATGAAWLKGRNSQRGREEQKHPDKKKKRKTHLTHTGLLMEGLENTECLLNDNAPRNRERDEPHKPEENSPGTKIVGVPNHPLPIYDH